MKNLLLITLIAILLPSLSLKAQINNVIVETYYVSDANDATDTIDGSARALPEGSKTYRIYIEIEPGSKVKKIYGDSLHTLKIISTDIFFNNIDRPNEYFGYLINKAYFSNNPTLTLDSWITLGMATKTHYGILKTNDTDGSIIGGTHNNGGTSGIPGGLLINTDTEAGIPIVNEDGLSLSTVTLSQWVDDGFKDGTGTDTTIFGSVNTGSEFVSNKAYLQQNSGVVGAFPDSNRVLVAQLTTKGEISFELNIMMSEPNGSSFKDVKYVAKLATGDVNSDTLKVSPYLTYPQACGCRDPHYLEYSSNYACDNSDSCRTPIVLGCMDTNACNYNPNANFNIPSLCCYPGYCNDRDIAVVCPEVLDKRMKIYPNPAKDELTLQITADNNEEAHYAICDLFGTVIKTNSINLSSGNSTQHIDISKINEGVYMLRLFKIDSTEEKMFIKN